MFDGNAFINELVGKNWMILIIIYGVFRAAFPNSKILNAIREGFSNLFPVFKKKELSTIRRRTGRNENLFLWIALKKE